MTEKEIESQILQWLNYQHDVFAFKVNTTGTFDPTRKVFRTIKNPFIHKGTSDILGVKKSKFFCLEVKTPATHKKLLRSPGSREISQLLFISQVVNRGGFGAIVSTLQQAMDFIKNIA